MTIFNVGYSFTVWLKESTFFSGLENKDNLRPVQRSRRARSGQAGCGGYHQEVQRYGQVVFPFKRE